MTEEVKADVVKVASFPQKPKQISVGMKIPKHFRLTENSLEVVPDENGKVPWDDAELQGRQLFKLVELSQNHVPWWIGDYILFCEEAYGERFAQVVDAGRYSAKSIRNMIWVAKHVKRDNRWPPEQLSWSHHMVVASLEPESQRVALQKAFDESWSVTELRLWLAGSSKPEKDASSYNALYRASFIKRGALPEGIKEKPFMEDHRKRVMVDAEAIAASIDKRDNIAVVPDIIDVVVGKEIKLCDPATSCEELWNSWWSANKAKIDEEENPEKACRYVFEEAFGLARKAFTT